VRRGLNAAGSRRGRPYWRSKLLDFLLIPAFGLMILAAIIASATVQVLLERGAKVGPLTFDTNRAFHLASYGLTAMVSFAMFFLLYRFVPAERERWRPVVASALCATVLFEFVKNAGAFLISKAAFSTDTAIYAGFSTAFAFLFWMFVNASILLVGAEFGRAIALHGRAQRQEELLAEASARHTTQIEGATSPVSHLPNL
jgi:membrane protein